MEARIFLITLLLGFTSFEMAFGFETALSLFQVRYEKGKILANVSTRAKGPAAEIAKWMEAAKVPKTFSPKGDPHYSSGPLWAYTNSTGSAAFFTRIPLDDSRWNLIVLEVSDSSTTPAVLTQGTQLFLDNESSHQLYDIMAKAGVKESASGPISSYQGDWVGCHQRNFDPTNPFWVCVLQNYKK